MIDLGDVDPKDPGEAKYYTLNLTSYLNSGASISSATWTCPGLTFGTPTNSGATSTVKISSGQDQQDYAIQVDVTTSDSETLVFGCRLKVRRATIPRSA